MMINSFFMINSFLTTIIIAVVTGLVIIVIALVWLAHTHLKLKHDYQVLVDIVRGNNNDIVGLCTAALAVDRRIDVMDGQISALFEKISDSQHNELSTHPYGLAIQKIRSGASVSELMQNSGLSQDEAALLIRLHGSKVHL